MNYLFFLPTARLHQNIVQRRLPRFAAIITCSAILLTLVFLSSVQVALLGDPEWPGIAAMHTLASRL